MSIDKDTVKHISKLARISLEDKNVESLAKDLTSILKFIEKINSKGETEFKIMLPVKTRYLYHNQVMEICEKAEITIENYYGDFNFGEINKNSDDMIYVCKN